jgi:hypothetical protein
LSRGAKVNKEQLALVSKIVPFYVNDGCKASEHVRAYKRINAIILADLLGEDGQSKLIPM